MKYLTILFFIISANTYCLQAEYNESGEIILKGHCLEVNAELDELKEPGSSVSSTLVENKGDLFTSSSEKLCNVDLSSVISEDLSELVGKTYNKLGPNCFGIAMMVSGHINEVRGVDLKEFSYFIDNQCAPVDVPRPGDIGTFINPANDFIHAYYYLSSNLVIEKTGVDLVGKTPVYLRNKINTFYAFEADQYCRQFGDETCFNRHQFYRCEKSKVKVTNEIVMITNLIEQKIANVLTSQLSKTQIEKDVTIINRNIETLQKHIEGLKDFSQLRIFLEAKQDSYVQQLCFLGSGKCVDDD